MVLAEYARSVAESLAALGGEPTRWVRQMKAAHADPQLRAAQAAHMAQVEAGIAAGLAERLGADPGRDAYPTLLASAATGVLRATMSFWAASGGAVPLDRLVGAAYRRWPTGFPRTVTAWAKVRANTSTGLLAGRTRQDRKDHNT